MIYSSILIDMEFGRNGFVCCILALIVILYFTNEIRSTRVEKEPFETMHAPPAPPVRVRDVNRRPDQEMEDMIQSNLTKKALLSMTESGAQGADYAPA